MKDSNLYIYSFYRFLDIKNKISLKKKLDAFFLNKTMRGTILIANEGINVSISGNIKNLSETVKFIKKNLNIKKIEIKIQKNNFLPFNKIKVRIKNEIVTLGTGNIDIEKYRGKLINPKEWNFFIKDKNTKIIDVRNEFEINIGKFQTALNPKTTSFREFPNSINKLKINKKDKIAMYCTGGIRCEKASAFLKLNGFKDVALLEGGILNYLNYINKFKKKSLWNGECFVFDNRVAINNKLKKGRYTQCYGCRHPITERDTKLKSYIKGVCCKYCYKKRTKKQKTNSNVRQNQIIEAEKLKKNHPFRKIYFNDLKAKI